MRDERANLQKIRLAALMPSSLFSLSLELKKGEREERNLLCARAQRAAARNDDERSNEQRATSNEAPKER